MEKLGQILKQATYSTYELMVTLWNKVNEIIDNVNIKVDRTGDFQGTWHGLLPSQTNESVSAMVEQYDSRIDNLEVLVPNKSDIKYVYDRMAKYTQWKDLVFGQEHLIAFHKKIGNPALKWVFTGDSTTAGAFVESPKWFINEAFTRMLNFKGFNNFTVVNRGVSGASTAHWVRDHVDGDIAQNPDVVVVRWGINDPAYDDALNLLPNDSGSYDIRRNEVDFETSLRAGLQKLRNYKSSADLTIILMTPNSVSHDVSFRNEDWLEKINPIIRKCARDFQCVFIDTYRIYQDSRNASAFMDTMDGGHVHPLAMMNLWITNLIYNVAFPNLFELEYNVFNKENLLTPLATWVNVANYEPLGYIKENHIKIRLQGTVSNGTRTQNTILASGLPVPKKNQMLIGVGEMGACEYYIDTTGNLKIWSVPATGWISIDGCTYLIDTGRWA